MQKFFLLIFFYFLKSFAFSQSQSDLVDSTSIGIELNEVIISATKFPQQVKQLAQHFQVLSAEQMKFINQPTTAELLQQTGNVLVQKSQLGGGSPVIRGFEANKLLIVVDGVRLNNAIYRGGHLQNIITIDNAILDKAEIVFGPSSVVYGSDALGGVMSFYTKKPAFSNSKKCFSSSTAFLRFASAYDEKTAHVDFVAGNKNISSLSSVTYTDFGNLKQGSNYDHQFPDWGKRKFYVKRINEKDSVLLNKNPQIQKETGYSQYDFLQKVLLKAGRSLHTFNLQYSNSSNINRYDRLTETDNSGLPKSAEWYYGPQKRFLAAWTVDFGKSSWFNKGSVTASVQDIMESRHNRNFQSTKLNHRTERVKVYALNADFNNYYKKGEIRYGAEIILNRVKSTAYFENINDGTKGQLDTRYPDGGSSTQSYALYITNTHVLSRKLILSDGLRFTGNRLFSKFNDKTFFPFPFNDVTQHSNSMTGNVGLVYLPFGDWKVAALISSGFRTPNVDDLSKVFESHAGVLIIPNPNLKPERTWNYEIGVSKKVNKKYDIGFSLWYCNYQNALSTDSGAINGSHTILYNGTLSNIITMVNKNEAYLWGTSANASVNLSKHINLAGVINYTYGRIKNTAKADEPLDHIAPVFGKLSINAHYKKFMVELFMLYNGTKDSSSYKLLAEDNELYSADPVNGYTPSWTTINWRSSFHINKNLVLQLAVENIFDKFYRVFASGLSASGRNFVFTLRGSF
jgi:hemoglobin/transferrin/lactoferrin receptor protein